MTESEREVEEVILELERVSQKRYIPSRNYYPMLRELVENLPFNYYLKVREIIEKYAWSCGWNT